MKENSIEDINYLDSMVKEYKQFGNLYNEDYEDEDRIYQALEHILSDYKRVLKENEKKNKIIDLMENYMVENGWEICFDNIYAELNNCNGMERDWCRGDKLEKQDIHKYFSKKLLESEE